MSVPAKISELVDRFQQKEAEYRSTTYNEEQTKSEFIDHFFEALGWDIDNTKNAPESYREVIRQYSFKIDDVRKAPDYCFRIGKSPQFFLEAKKPSVNIAQDSKPTFQLRRYGWSASLPISILTDFEELAIYDCRIQPNVKDKPTVARIFYCKYTEYIDRWNEITSLISREAVFSGSLNQFITLQTVQKGNQTVDDAFLNEIEDWRNILAENLIFHNPQLNSRDLNFAVQITINRIIFLRICEDRGTEDYGTLKKLEQGSNVYERLCQIFFEADNRYNSGLFHFKNEQNRPDFDGFTPTLIFGDIPLKNIIKNLYYPSPYAFSVIPIEIIGQVYEQFLGKVITLKLGSVTVEDKPEVRKAGGVYYTPTYIVDYIVKNTIGKLLEGKTAKQAAKLRILDPSCGSGSFLIGAYQYLLEWYRDYYLNHQTRNSPIYESISGWQLTTNEKKKILLDNIFGIDIDAQAVEVTKLSLLLKVLEGETQENSYRQTELFRVLPDLDENIRCGNSLVSSDFYDNIQMQLLSEDEFYQINVFDWDKKFALILQEGGFDAIIGNPPWGAELQKMELDYHRHKNQEIIVRMIDSFMFFVYQTSKILQKNGCFGQILPDVILYQIDNFKLREYILNNFRINRLLNMGDVFEKVVRPASILTFDKGKLKNNQILVQDLSSFSKAEKMTKVFEIDEYENLLQDNINDIPTSLFITKNVSHYKILARILSSCQNRLKDYMDQDGIQRGVSPDLKEAFIVDSNQIREYRLESAYLRKVLTGGKQVRRYHIDYPDLWLIYTNRNENFQNIPNICRYIDKFRSEITCREVIEGKHPLYALHRPREEKIFLKSRKLLGVITQDRIIVALDDSQFFATDGLYLLSLRENLNYYYFLGILNSKLFVFLYRLLTLEKGRVLAQVKPTILKKLPIKSIDFSNKIESDSHDRLVSLVEQMMSLHNRIKTVNSPNEKKVIQKQIEITDRQIDQLVYQLYELTDAEIAIVENI
jgi:type I restriction-modification system DNA methylase subunit